MGMDEKLQELESINRGSYVAMRGLLHAGKIGTMPSTGESVGTTSTLLLSANPDRVYALFTNESDTPAWLAFGENAVEHKGVYLAAAGGSYEVGWDNLWLGVINAIASADAKVIGVVEGLL